MEQLHDIHRTIDRLVSSGKKVYVHCWGGINRTGFIVGCWFVYKGMPVSGPFGYAVVLIIALLLFGSRLPGMMRSLGRSVVEFKKGVAGVEEEIDGVVRSVGEKAKAEMAAEKRESGDLFIDSAELRSQRMKVRQDLPHTFGHFLSGCDSPRHKIHEIY